MNKYSNKNKVRRCYDKFKNKSVKLNLGLNFVIACLCKQIQAGKCGLRSPQHNRAFLQIVFVFFITIVFYIFLPSIPSANLFAQKYEGLIKQSDFRVKDLMILLKKKEESTRTAAVPSAAATSIPNEFRLRYSRMEQWIYLVFYDLDGREIWFRFRDIRWDDRGDRILKKVIPGDAYIISGDYLGLIHKGRLIRKENQKYKDILKDADSMAVFKYTESRQISPEYILY
jgi:hypothetical protein